MFIAKFSQVSVDSEKFTADDNGNMPYIGEILAGRAEASIINGTIFEREGLEPNVMYACETKEVEGTRRDGSEATFINVIILDRVPLRDYLPLKKELGKGVLVREAKAVEEEVDQAQAIDDLLG